MPFLIIFHLDYLKFNLHRGAPEGDLETAADPKMQ